MKIAIDSNLLLLLIVGIADPIYIARHKRLSSFSLVDFEFLDEIMLSVSEIVVTPNTLTETSNLAGYIAEPARSHIFATLRAAILAPRMRERFIESRVAASQSEFLRLGLTDAALLQAADEPATLLTADVDLYLAAVKRGFKAENFNYLRRH
jgi:hypothetical protein